MKSTFLFLLIFPVFTFAQGGCEENISDDDAIKIASNFLKEKEWNDQYLLPKETFTESGCKWIIGFKHKDWETIKPSMGMISVNKKTGKAKWLPSR